MAMSWLVELATHILLYVIIFFAAAFYAARNYRQRQDPEAQPFAESQRKSGSAMLTGRSRKGLGGAHTGGEYTMTDAMEEAKVFVNDPVPFLVETSAIDDDAVHHRAGLEARIYLHFLNTMLILFTVMAALVCVVILPANIMNAKASWMPMGGYERTTSNGFVHPSSELLLHTLVSLFISGIVLVVAYFMREHLIGNVRGELTSNAAIPPVQAYTVEIQGMRLAPPVTASEIAEMLDTRLKGEYTDIMTAEDVTEIVDFIDTQKNSIKQLARYREQYENEGVRPTSIVGPLSWMYVGERVDAIEKLEADVMNLDREIERSRSRRLVGTGTAFVTFKKRKAASDCVRLFQNARRAQSMLGLPSIGNKPDDLCANPGLWHVGMATRPEDVCWRNLRYSKFQHGVLTFIGVVCLLIALSFIVTPLFFIQVLLSVEEVAVEEADDATSVVTSGKAASAYQRQFRRGSIVGGWWTNFFISLLTPGLILLINFYIMPAMVKWAVKHFGHRTKSGINGMNFSLIFFFMIVNLLFIPALSLGSLEALLEVTQFIPFDQILAQVVLYGSAGVFFIDYAAQAALLATSFYFVFHTTSPQIHDWATGGKKAGGVPLTWEFDFAYFYSSLLSVIAIALMFAVTVPLLLPMVVLFLYARYYTDKWQLVTSHSNANPDPSPETTASSAIVCFVAVAALAEAAFAAWLGMQNANELAVLAWVASGFLLFVILVPPVRRRLVTVSSTWVDAENEHPETWEVTAPASYAGAYKNPYIKDGARDSLTKFFGEGGYAGYGGVHDRSGVV